MKIRTVSLDRRHPSVDVRDLGLMLEIDLMLGAKREFGRRLQRALDDACRQGCDLASSRLTAKPAQMRHLTSFGAKNARRSDRLIDKSR